MSEVQDAPNGSVDNRKYAAIFLALGIERGALLDVVSGRTNTAKEILGLTGTAKIAEALGCSENDLAIDWADHLTPDEINQIKGL